MIWKSLGEAVDGGEKVTKESKQNDTIERRGIRGNNEVDETLEVGVEYREGIRLSVSHGNLTGKIQKLGEGGSVSSTRAYNPYSGPKKTKDKALKEIINKLNLWIIKLKHNKAGTTIGTEAQNKDLKGDIRVRSS